MTRIYHLNRTREIINEYGLDLKKSLGQNFLIDGNVLKKIASAGDIDENSAILEVGPGIGSLTEELLLTGARVNSIEIDQRFYPILEGNLGHFEGFKLFKGDATKKELFKEAAEGRTHFIANLPYVVTTPILENIFTLGSFQRAIIMVQKEVAVRMTAKPGSKNYSALSVFVDYFAQAKELFLVKRGAFIPSPKVESSVVELKLRDRKGHDTFMKLVHAAFGMRRKTILNSISMGLNCDKEILSQAFERSKINPQSRAENLSVDDYLKLEEELKEYL